MPRLAEGSKLRLTSRPLLLTIAGFDPSSGAGITADLKVFAAHHCFGMACVTALTVQSTQGVKGVEPVSAATVEETVRVLAEDVTFDGIKIGMLGTADAVGVVGRFLREGGPARERTVLDPVLRSSSGRPLLDPDGVIALKRDLLGAVGCITPNLEELGMLAGLRVDGRDEVAGAAIELQEMAGRVGNPGLAVFVTGGHLAKPDDYLLCPDGSEHWLAGERVETTSTHGTGCALSSALVSQLALGENLIDAATKAKAYVAQALRVAYPVGKGRGPMNHLFEMDGL